MDNIDSSYIENNLIINKFVILSDPATAGLYRRISSQKLINKKARYNSNGRLFYLGKIIY